MLAFVRPWIYKQGTLVDGNFTLEIFDGATLLKSVAIPYTDINTLIPANYAHGYVRFEVDPVSLNVDDDEANHVYTFKFKMVGHTTNTTNFIGICRDWDDPKYTIYGTPPPNDSVQPMGIEIYTYTRRI